MDLTYPALGKSASVVVTSIASPNAVLKQLATDSKDRGLHYVVVGDSKSPSEFSLDGCDFYSLDRQLSLDFSFAKICPTRHYARKNIGYLIAIARKSKVIIETDDDNFPTAEFFLPLPVNQEIPRIDNAGWVNVYRYYSDSLIWPRGIPLDSVNSAIPSLDSVPAQAAYCPIQQGLANDNPDVDAIYRLLLPLPQDFAPGEKRIALGRDTWCPFNSQNTIFFQEAFPLLYLPAYCSFRMTDIWRSFVAQRIGWENGWSILFREATVRQERNDHNLMRDFADEVSGYINNRKIAETLSALTLQPGVEKIPDNLRSCYRSLVDLGVVGSDEMPLLDAWLSDLQKLEDSGNGS